MMCDACVSSALCISIIIFISLLSLINGLLQHVVSHVFNFMLYDGVCEYNFGLHTFMVCAKCTDPVML